jgi:hypothetical protein
LYINRVVLDHIKSFDDAELAFGNPGPRGSAGWAVITGDNGSGKTALLRAIALAVLGPDQSRGLVPDLRGWATHGAARGTVSVEVRPNSQYDKTLKGGYPTDSFWAEIEITDGSGVWTLAPADIFRKKKKGASNGPWPEGTPGWFTLGYGPFRRLYGSSADAQRLMVLPGRIPRFATLFREDATLAEGEEWIKNLRYRTLERKLEDEQILNNVLDLLRDEFLRNEFTIDDVNSEGVWLRDSAHTKLPLADMSEGYRSALAMMLDICRHMFQVYGPHIMGRGDDGRVTVDRPGVVMIDEVDAHLHPEWQRTMGFWLKAHFPQVQFIVTTHSPLVCQAADFGRIYHLPQPGGGSPFKLSREDYETVIAGKPDEILLTPAFDLKYTRSPRAVASREKHALLYAKALSKKGLSDAERVEMEQLRLFVGDD